MKTHRTHRLAWQLNGVKIRAHYNEQRRKWYCTLTQPSLIHMRAFGLFGEMLNWVSLETGVKFPF